MRMGILRSTNTQCGDESMPNDIVNLCLVTVKIAGFITSSSFWLIAGGMFVLRFFFFSSRRRHTRCSRDWSSDVCSSDLGLPPAPAEMAVARRGRVRVPEPDADGRILVPVTDVLPLRLPSSGPPAGWDLQEFAGHASVQVVHDEGRGAGQLQRDRAAFALHPRVALDLQR